MATKNFSDKTKILSGCTIAWAIGGTILVVLLNWSLLVLVIPLIILLILTIIFTVSDIFY